MYSILLAVLFTYINIPCADMREEASETSKMASQAIYSEKVEILQEQSDWAKIKTTDNYSGWVKKKSLFQSKQPFPSSQNAVVATVYRCAAHVYGVQDTEYGPMMTLPFESLLEVVDEFGNPEGRWIKVKLVDGTTAFIQRGDVSLGPILMGKPEMLSISMSFLGLPYTWGGRSSFGYDCSGFVQMLYRLMGIAIPRDSKDQAAWSGFQEVPIERMLPGDLIFFGSLAPKITHVGMYIGEGRFIHTSSRENKPYLRISRLSDHEWNGNGCLKNRTARAIKFY